MLLPSRLWAMAVRRFSSRLVRTANCMARNLGPVFVLMALALVGCCTWVYFTVIIPYHFPMRVDEATGVKRREKWGMCALAVVWSTYLLACISFHYAMAIRTPPGSPPETERVISLRSVPRSGPPPTADGVDDDDDDDSGDDDDAAFTGCRKCGLPKPPRTHHCSICNKCIYRYDHHCPWINGCVGHFNYRYFLLFMVYLVVAGAYFSMMAWVPFKEALGRSVIRLRDVTPNETSTEPNLSLPASSLMSSAYPQSLIVFTFIIAVAMSLAIGGLCGWHAFLVSTNQTTVEFYRNSYVHKVAMSGGGSETRRFNEYDRGIRENLEEFFNVGEHGQYRWYTIFLPIPVSPVGNGRTFPTYNSQGLRSDLHYEFVQHV